MLIHKALLKYRYSSFSLEILEYCEPKKCIEREQYYLDLLKPEYNILKNAGSLLGFKHSEETKAKFKGRKHSEETKAKMREKALTPERLEHLKIYNSSQEHKDHLNRLHADPEYKAKRLAQLKIYHSSQEHKDQLKRLAIKNKGRARPEGAGVPRVALEVFDT
jgi:group I intron endonuclease